MIEIPWWAYSPSPFTFVFWGILALYGCTKLKPRNRREWIGYLATSAFIVGLVVLPFDILWTVHQALTFGHLFPQDLAELMPLFNIKLLVWILCLYECRKLFRPKSHLNATNLFDLSLYIPLLVIWFTLAPDPSWTDWTFAWRFGYDTTRIIQSFMISHGVAKALQALIFVKLWKK